MRRRNCCSFSAEMKRPAIRRPAAALKKPAAAAERHVTLDIVLTEQLATPLTREELEIKTRLWARSAGAKPVEITWQCREKPETAPHVYYYRFRCRSCVKCQAGQGWHGTCTQTGSTVVIRACNQNEHGPFGQMADCMVVDKPSPVHECDSPFTVRFKGGLPGSRHESHVLVFLA